MNAPVRCSVSRCGWWHFGQGCPDHPTVNEITGTQHDGLCEECEAALTRENLTEGDLGFYCSSACLSRAESGPSHDHREDFHADG